MGRLYYDGMAVLDIDDRTLAHVRAAVMAKLRRGEKFTFSWQVPAEQGSGRNTIWIHPAIPLRFQFRVAPGALNAAWVEQLLVAAHSTGGLVLVPEPDSGRKSEGAP